VNKRKHPRVATSLHSEAKPLQHTMFEAKVVNFSVGGAFIETGQRLVLGSEVMLCVNLEFKGQRKKPCMLQGKVAWTNYDRKKGAMGCGIAFHHVSASMLKTLEEFVAQHSGKEIDGFGAAEKEPKKASKPTRGQLRG